MIESVNDKYLDSKDLLNEYFVILQLESIPIYFEILFDIRENARNISFFSTDTFHKTYYICKAVKYIAYHFVQPLKNKNGISSISVSIRIYRRREVSTGSKDWLWILRRYLSRDQHNKW